MIERLPTRTASADPTHRDTFAAIVKNEIERRFELNLERVRSLVAVYVAALPGVSGRPPTTTTDILRASVVFLHATLEDLLRSILAWRLPLAKPEHLVHVPLLGVGPGKYTLGDVAKHRGMTVDELLVQSVAASLEHSSFNNADEIARALTRSGLATTVLDPHAANLDAITSRRHWIVHRADRNTQAQGSGNFAARSLSHTTVSAWVGVVEAFGQAVLALL